MDVDRLKKIAGAVRTGGKGTVRRKKKAVHKAATTDDKRLQNTLKRLGVNVIPGIEEVMIMKDDNVIHFANPKGFSQMLPSLLPHMNSPDELKKLKGMMPRPNGMPPINEGADDEEDDDDEVPELVDGFDDTVQ